MAITNVQNQVLWSTASSVTLSTNTESVSDVVTLDATCIKCLLQISVDNQGTPTSGDTLTVRIRQSTGDILGDTGNDYDTAEHAQFVTLLDTVAANTPGEDPARRVIEINPTQNFQVAVTWNSAAPGTRNAVVRARIEEQRAA